jgi:predicted porin
VETRGPFQQSQVVDMKGIGLAVASAAAMLLGGGSAFAADLSTMPTKAPVLQSADTTCTSILDFFTTACQVAGYGVRFYGTIDIGGGYQTNGAPFDKLYGPGLDYFPGKANQGGKWLLSPNALTASNVGLQVKESLGSGWSFIGQYEFAFDPYSLDPANGVGSVHENLGLPLAQQTSSGDSSSQGRFYNSLAFAGVSNNTWGTLTFGRQNELTRDAVTAYDPMGGSYAFSLIGYFGATGGAGVTETAKGTTSVKYRVDWGNYRLGLFGQFGGYDLGNASQGAFQGSLGADFNVGPGQLSVDAIGSYTKDAINEALSGGVSALGVVNPLTPQTLTATLSDNTSAMIVAKYTLDRLKLYAGYEWMQFANPSDPDTTSFYDTAGYLICAGCTAFNGTTISTTTYNKDKVLQVVWAGARYSLTQSVDLVGAYYHYDQNAFATGASVTNCAITSVANSSCAGTQDVGSFLIDWKLAPKWDTYIGTMYTKLNGGLASGYLANNNWETTAGVRFRW